MSTALPADIDHIFKVLLIGDSGVGKSRYECNAHNRQHHHNMIPVLFLLISIYHSILLRFTDGRYQDKTNSTIGVDFKSKIMSVTDKAGNSKKIKLTVWDTAGQERFRTLTSNYYRGAHAVIFVFDSTSSATFDNLEGWLQEVEQHVQSQEVIKVLVCNKTDQTRVVSREDAASWSSSKGMEMIETSAKLKEGIDELFQRLTVKVSKESPTPRC